MKELMIELARRIGVTARILELDLKYVHHPRVRESVEENLKKLEKLVNRLLSEWEIYKDTLKRNT